MTPSSILMVDLLSALRCRRAWLLRTGLPLLLGLPFVVVAMPVTAKVLGLVVLMVFTGMFGAAVSAVRRRSGGLAARLRVMPVPRSVVFLDHAISGAAVDILQVTPLLVLFLAVNARGASAQALVALGLCVAGSFFALNCLGMVLALLTKSNAEVHLLGALAVALVVFCGGVVPLSGRVSGIVAVTAAVSPAGWLAAAIRSCTGGPESIPAGAFCSLAALCLFGVLRLRAYRSIPAPPAGE